MSETPIRRASPAATRLAPETAIPAIDAGERAALLEGRHANPHQLLGAHAALVGGVSGVVVRVLQPAAADCAVVVHGVATPLRAEGDGLFAGFLSGVTVPFRYHLRFIAEDGTTWERGDAYRHWPTIGEMDLYLFREGTHRQLWTMLGAHLREVDGDEGTAFALWAPNAERVSVVGDWCGWDGRQFPMRRLGDSGLWELFIPGVLENALYKYELRTKDGGIRVKTDPIALKTEQAPNTASIVVRERTYPWNDDHWMRDRPRRDWQHEPM